VTLTTGGLSQWNWNLISKDRATYISKKYPCISVRYASMGNCRGRSGGRFFCPAARFAVYRLQTGAV
jgi:hypothetical protein